MADISRMRRTLTPRKVKAERIDNDDDDVLKKHRAQQQRRIALVAQAAATPQKNFSASKGRRVVKDLSPSKDQNQETVANFPEIYAKAVGLCNSNKISSHNAWTLHMIDYLNRFAEAPLNGETNFQRASVALEAGAKIYSVRVDDVHTHAYRILAGLNRAGDQQGASRDDESGDEDRGETKKRSKRIHSGKTLAKAGANDLERLELAPELNQLLRQSTATTGETGSASLLLAHLPTVNGCLLAFDGAVVPNDVKPPHPQQIRPPFDIGAYRAECLPTAQQLAGSSLCHATESHSFGTAMQLQLPPDSTAPEASYDEDVWEATVNGPTIDWAVAEGNESDEGIGCAPASPTNHNKDIFSAVATGEGGLYSYLPQLQASNWAGPMHWRPRTVKQAVGPKERKASARHKIDFENVTVPREKFNLAKGTLSLSSSSSSAPLLPPDHGYSPESLQCLLTRPGSKVEPHSSAVSQDHVHGLDMDTAYNYANERDADYVAPDDDDDDMEPENEPINTQPEQSLFYAGEEVDMASDLVAAPQTVGTTRINYSRLAKKVDVQVLKEGLWTRLVSHHPQDGELGKAESVSFQEAVAGLPSDLGPKLGNANVALCFVCLLHLANEKGLSVTSTPSLDDLLISTA